MIGENFKEHCKALDKHIYFPELKEIFDIFEDVVEWSKKKKTLKKYITMQKTIIKKIKKSEV